jgi:predicted aspartyl protease
VYNRAIFQPERRVWLAGLRMRLLHSLCPLCLFFGSAFLTAQSAANGPTKPSPQVSPPADSPAPDPVGEAKVLLRKGDFDAALQKYQQLLQERPRSPDAWSGVVRVYLKKREVQRAAETVSQARMVTDAWPLHIAIGELYFRQGKISDAEKEWVEVLDAGHRNARVYLGLARVRWALSMNQSATLMIDEAHNLDPADPDVERFWRMIHGRAARPQGLAYDDGEGVAASKSHSESADDVQPVIVQPGADSLQARRSCTLLSKVTSAEMRMVRMLIDPEHLRGYGLSVVVDGASSTLLLDTGASGILLSREIAEKAGLKKLADTRITGIGDSGDQRGYLARAPSIRVGNLEFQNCLVRVAESRSVLGRDGLIGAEMFQDYLVDIDFPVETLHLRELPKPPSGTAPPIAPKGVLSGTTDASLQTHRNEETPTTKVPDSGPSPSPGVQDRYIAPDMRSFTPVYRFGHDLLVSTKVGDVPTKLFLLDTGAIDNAISLSAAREVSKVSGESHTVLKGLSGSVLRLYSANKAILQFGHIRQENQDILAFDFTGLSDDIGTEVSGTLGFTLLRMLDVKIDYRDGLVDFDYDPKRLLHF